ncbi:MAG TPA: hypothetical protein VEL76_32450, partial [Gemmataceae bacterium]|nr:hypothetical protein [Gemmataceae bacterium]
ELRTWWQNLTPQVQQLLQDGSLVLAALLGGHFLGVMVTRALRSRNFDAALRVPGGSPPEGEADRGITPTLIAGILVRMTIWTACAWWLARQHEQVELASSLARVINRTWALATVLVAALAIGSLLATRLIDALQGFTKAGAEATPAKNGAAVSQKHVAGAVGAAVYGLVVLLTLLIAADVFEWPLTRTSATALWQLAHHLLIAGAALLVGGLGARWARDLVVAEGTVTPEKRAAQYTALGIVAATTVLAVAVLLSSAGVLIGLAAVAVLGFLLWLVSGYLPDVTAGLQLRAQQVREVWIDKEMWQVTEIGFLATQVTRSGEFCRLQNRVVLEARLHGAPSEGSVR